MLIARSKQLVRMQRVQQIALDLSSNCMSGNVWGYFVVALCIAAAAISSIRDCPQIAAAESSTTKSRCSRSAHTRARHTCSRTSSQRGQ